MILSGISELLSLHSSDWKWDFVLNLSESDYPVKSNQALRAYLGANRGEIAITHLSAETAIFTRCVKVVPGLGATNLLLLLLLLLLLPVSEF
jgi:hypothetical protein